MSKKKGTGDRSGKGDRPQNLVGKVIVGMYPRHNFQGVPTYCERRAVLVEKVRVLRSEPLDALTPTINPLLNRGKTLITGTDLDKHAERSFYLESFRIWETFDSMPDAGIPDAGIPEAGMPKAGISEAAVSEADLPLAVVLAAGAPEPVSKLIEPVRHRGKPLHRVGA